jgi:Zn/Cd-binding protein ZinT
LRRREKMGLRGRIKKLTRQAEEGAVLIRLKDGTSRVFDDLTCWKAMFLAQMDLFKGEAHESEVLDAVRAAKPECRRAFEAEYGEIEMEARIITSELEGGWVEVFTLLEDGTVERAYHEGGSEEAERIRLEAQQSYQAGPMSNFSG